MWRSGGLRPDSVVQKRPAAGPGLRGPYRLLVIVAIVFAIVILGFPLVFGARVEPPTNLRLGSPFSMEVRITNPDVTPLTDVEYSCEVSKLTLASGAEVSGARILIRGTARKISGRSAIAAPCETAYIVNAPVKTAEYKLTLTYRTFPWPQRRTRVYHIAAQIEPNGRVTGWKVT